MVDLPKNQNWWEYTDMFEFRPTPDRYLVADSMALMLHHKVWGAMQQQPRPCIWSWTSSCCVRTTNKMSNGLHRHLICTPTRIYFCFVFKGSDTDIRKCLRLSISRTSFSMWGEKCTPQLLTPCIFSSAKGLIMSCNQGIVGNSSLQLSKYVLQKKTEIKPHHVF